MPLPCIGPASGKAGGKELALVPARAQPPATAPVVGAAPAASAVDRTSTAITTTDRYVCKSFSNICVCNVSQNKNPGTRVSCSLTCLSG